ncbi:MAG TPA: hypothetical protein VHV54_04340 [Candidatus Binatia bacterium]|nr:hypothetical protein [Candidatus Binatia bacterium]
MRRYVGNFVFAILIGVLLSACGAGDKGPAEAALKAAEEAVNAARGEASKYLPDQVRSLDAALASAKEKFNKGDYKAALADANDLTVKAKEIASAAATKKVELAKTWDGFSNGFPRVVDAIKSRVDILSQSKKLPAGMTPDNLATAKAGLADITQQWTAATDASKSGNLADAVAKTGALKAKAVEVLTALKMPVPEALRA